MADVPVTDGAKWQNLSAFMMNLASKQFYVTLAVIVFEGLVLYIGVRLPEKVTNDAYIALLGVVHSFLLPVVLFWFKNDQENRRVAGEKGNANANS